VTPIELWPIERLVEYLRNRKNDVAVNRTCGSIHGFGFKIPCLVRSDAEIVDGHLRLKAARKLGIAEIPLILCDEWSPAQVKALRLMVNRSVTSADWDDDLLALELREISCNWARPASSGIWDAAPSQEEASSEQAGEARNSSSGYGPHRSATDFFMFTSKSWRIHPHVVPDGQPFIRGTACLPSLVGHSLSCAGFSRYFGVEVVRPDEVTAKQMNQRVFTVTKGRDVGFTRVFRNTSR
jgi:hypothetical protein